MSSGLPIQVCTSCGKALFPRRALCPICGGTEFVETTLDEGSIEERTVHRGTSIGSIKTPAGPIVIARLADEVNAGSRVVLEFDAGAPVASRLA